MAYQVFTQNSYGLDEIISALQKDIRRGNEEQALYWALELLPRYEVYLWRRLAVICNEDIGIANPEILVQVQVLRAQYFEFREQGKDGTCRLILANAILLMCRSPKAHRRSLPAGRDPAMDGRQAGWHETSHSGLRAGQAYGAMEADGAGLRALGGRGLQAGQPGRGGRSLRGAGAGPLA